MTQLCMVSEIINKKFTILLQDHILYGSVTNISYETQILYTYIMKRCNNSTDMIIFDICTIKFDDVYITQNYDIECFIYIYSLHFVLKFTVFIKDSDKSYEYIPEINDSNSLYELKDLAINTIFIQCTADVWSNTIINDLGG